MINNIENSDAIDCYEKWPSPHLIISDGPYGLGLYPGEIKTPKTLKEWYLPHIEAWSKAATSQTTLWIWNSERGHSYLHKTLEDYGWHYQETTIWNKGLSHIAGRVNSKTIRGLPVTTEIATRYTRPIIKTPHNTMTIQDWIHSEWKRSGLPLSSANIACGVKNAATRKYLTSDEHWYLPPFSMIEKLAEYCTRHGRKTETPYFHITALLDTQNRSENVSKNAKDEYQTLKDAYKEAYDALKPRWNHQHGFTNVWEHPAVKSPERLKHNKKNLHVNQKPIELIKRQISMASHENDIIWEPFAGTATISCAAKQLKRNSYGAEINDMFYTIAQQRLLSTEIIL